MKTLAAIVLTAVIVNLIAWMLINAWDRESDLRETQTRQYIKWVHTQKGAQ